MIKNKESGEYLSKYQLRPSTCVSQLCSSCPHLQDTDSYIHRSGRTGRAGRQGTCVCFYKHQEEGLLRMVEHHSVSGHRSNTGDSQMFQTWQLEPVKHQSQSKEPVLMSVYFVKFKFFSKWKLCA